MKSSILFKLLDCSSSGNMELHFDMSKSVLEALELLSYLHQSEMHLTIFILSRKIAGHRILLICFCKGRLENLKVIIKKKDNEAVGINIKVEKGGGGT